MLRQLSYHLEVSWCSGSSTTLSPRVEGSTPSLELTSFWKTLIHTCHAPYECKWVPGKVPVINITGPAGRAVLILMWLPWVNKINLFIIIILLTHYICIEDISTLGQLRLVQICRCIKLSEHAKVLCCAQSHSFTRCFLAAVLYRAIFDQACNLIMHFFR